MNGELGMRLVDLSFVAAILAMVAYGIGTGKRSDARKWERLGNWSFAIHGLSILSAISLLWMMIFNQQYEYAYVYDHSSNTLPVQYIVACLWEGQEGSFMLWLFWNAVLGGLLIWRAGRWRPGVMAVISSVQAILASMIMGVTVSETAARFGLALVGLIILLLMLRQFFSWSGRLPHVARGLDTRNMVPVMAVALYLMIALNLILGHSGWMADALSGNIAFLLQLVFLLAFFLVIWYGYLKQDLSSHLLASGTALAALGYIIAQATLGEFKIGSSPFLTVHEAFPTNPTLLADPDYVPEDGTGLNALLQNYWMVIHPPTLFLGFASTVVPFAYVIAGLWTRRYKEWIDPASPWALFSVMILGVGIIMGGYWAYETLNFGGYWNWDPVENSSLVPWLVGVGGLHAMLSFRKSKKNLKAAMILMASTFVLVLYSTFLTRSGILGETSVHSFTDLGLSGQLLLLLFIYLGGVILLFVHHWRKVPDGGKTTTLFSREFFLFLAALVLAFTGIEIILVTSMPVINAIFGTNMAPPAEVTYFYYRWNVWFGILIALLSAVGQFFYWTKIEKKQLQKTVFRPFLIAAVSTVVIMFLVAKIRWEFAFQERYEEALLNAEGTWNTIKAYITTGIMIVADDILLFAGLFTLVANGYIILRLVRRSRKNLKHIGGSLAHIGFGLMLLGILFSSGFEDTLSINVNPEKLEAGLGKEEAITNVVLTKGKPVDIKEFRLIYRGVRPPAKPFDNFRAVNSFQDMMQVGFDDADGYRYSVLLPVPSFLKSEGVVKTSTDLNKYVNWGKVQYYIEQQSEMLPIKMLNKRRLYAVDFYPLARTDEGQIEVNNEGSFRLYPEAESQGEEGIIAHPDRAIFPNRDIYTHVTGRPSESDAAIDWNLILQETELHVDSSLMVDGLRVTIGNPERLPTPKSFGEHELLTHIPVRVQSTDSVWTSYPKLMVNKKTGIIIMVDAYLEPLQWRLRFTGISAKENTFKVAIAEAKPRQDYIILTAISKPWVNLLWLGTFIMTFGFLTAIYRRVSDLK